jgi:hypothetical protein
LRGNLPAVPSAQAGRDCQSRGPRVEALERPGVGDRTGENGVRGARRNSGGRIECGRRGDIGDDQSGAEQFAAVERERINANASDAASCGSDGFQ